MSAAPNALAPRPSRSTAAALSCAHPPDAKQTTSTSTRTQRATQVIRCALCAAVHCDAQRAGAGERRWYGGRQRRAQAGRRQRGGVAGGEVERRDRRFRILRQAAAAAFGEARAEEHTT